MFSLTVPISSEGGHNSFQNNVHICRVVLCLLGETSCFTLAAGAPVGQLKISFLILTTSLL
jgi:hypothetical protein